MLKSFAVIAIFVFLVKLVFASGNQNAEKCRENEVLSDCVNRVSDYRKCSELGKPIENVEIDSCDCKKGCICKPKYLRADNGTCIPANQCATACGINEVYDTCKASCPPRICNVDERVRCKSPPQPGDPDCEAGCRCADNYFRNDENVCVPKNECPLQCGENEIPTSCFEAICERRNCSDLGKPVPCIRLDPSFCTKGCLCKEGYLRDKNGICVPISQCPNIQCGKNETFDICPSRCPGEGCNVDPSLILCLPNPEPGDPDCNPGCRCQDNYFRNDYGLCVTRDQCPPQCGDNEIPTSCFEAICERRNCSDLGKPVACIRLDPRYCTNGCLCKEGYLRDENGICVPISQCASNPTLQCGENEIPTSCFEAICERRNCSDLGKPVTCIRLDPRYCTNGCLCKEGYLRDENGICVPISQCPTLQCGENEIPTSCLEAICERRNCSDIWEPVTCIRLDPRYCTKGCLCKEGYLRDENGICVPISQCPKECGDNEIRTPCFESVCERRHCFDIGQPVLCVRLNPRYCTNGCLCRKGYLRDQNGICVPMNQCPNIQCGKNETFDICPSRCPGEGCNVDPSLILCLPNPEPGDPDCKPGCRCQDNYFRDEYGLCVTRDQCQNPPNDICGPNEVATDCVNGGCGLWYCSQTEPICNLILDEACRPGCFCKDGWLRAENRTCIPADQCPPKCDGPNEYFSCGGACDNVCATLSTQNQTNCNIVNKKCNPKCYCQEGYARDANNICIPIKECPPTKPIICGADEVYNSCENGGCGRWKCSQPGLICIDLFEGACREGCRCKEGLLRADNGTCIPADQCPINCFGQNEVRGCHDSCSPQTCESIGKIYNCPLQTKECKQECRCKEGFFRNKIGECISKEDCLKCTRGNEFFSCGGACDNVCATLSSQNQTNCPIINIVCNRMCYCEEGYARDSNNTCVPISQCPRPVCGKNEVFDDCPATCPPRTCEALGRAYKCRAPPKPGDPECNPSCRCADNYYRNKQGVCVPKNKCPKPIVCGADEVYNSCVNGGCGRWNCSQPGIICIRLIEGACREGCRCKEGLLRADNGTCIPADQCPNLIEGACREGCRCKEGLLRADNGTCIPANQCSINCFGQNEVRGCHDSCSPQTCESIGKIYNCPLQTEECKQECRCKEGFFRNKIGECISKEDCLKCTRGNEFFSCGGACDNVCATLSSQNQTNCPIVNIACNRMCYCEEGYARDNNNTCVPISQCPRPVCGKNEVFDDCPATCPPRTCEALGRAYKCEAPPKPGDPECNPSCRCADNYYRNKQGVCVPKNKCPKPIVCGADEVYNSCVNGGCGRWKCSQPGKICINLLEGTCREGCRCKEGLLRADNGTCIPADQCPNNNNTNTELKEFEQGNVGFTLRFLYEATKNNPEASLIFSPFSVLFLLAQLALYAVGTTQEELLRLINLNNEQIRNFVPKYLDTLISQQNVSFDLVEKVYSNVQYKFSQGFEKDTSEIFKAEAENLDFCKPNEAASDINAWVQQKTNNLIKDLVSPDSLSYDTVLVLVNAIYFKGDWKYKFNPDNTRKQDFYVNSKKTVQVDMMSRTGTYKYGNVQLLDAQVVEIPYENDDFSLMIWLPNIKDEINKLIDKLLVNSNYSFSNILSDLREAYLHFSMPAFNITTTTDLKQLLMKMNTTAIFDPKVAQFAGILQNPETIYVTSATQKANIIVNESGSEAAAGNAVVVGVTSVQQSIEVIADHPFIYFIVYKGTPIFCGIYFANV